MNIILIFLRLCFVGLLSDAKLRKYFAQDVGGGDFAGYGAHGVEAAAEVGGYQVGRKVFVEPVAGIGKGLRRGLQRQIGRAHV